VEAQSVGLDPQPAEEQDLVGQQIGNYSVLDRLGRGGMGAVYLAENTRIERKVAIKVLARHLALTPRAARRFISEARAATRIDHPNVIDIYDFGELADGVPYYVMELLGGTPLRKVLEERAPLSPGEARPYVEQICAALQAAHERGIIHRDLKPENIQLVDHDPPTLKILDFGIAKILEKAKDAPDTTADMVVGTPLVIAPEQAAGEPDRIGPHTDIYSLGVILYWMLAGRPPFDDRSPGILLSRHLSEAPVPLEERVEAIPAGVAKLVNSCLEKEPTRRPASAVQIARRFTEALSGPPPAVEQQTPPAGRRGPWLALGLVAVGVAALLLIWSRVDRASQAREASPSAVPAAERKALEHDPVPVTSDSSAPALPASDAGVEPAPAAPAAPPRRARPRAAPGAKKPQVQPTPVPKRPIGEGTIDPFAND
jgi:serine/threonine-protein kinase